MRSLCCFALLFAHLSVAGAASDLAYLQQLQQQALDETLYKEKAWHDLLHYRADLLGDGVTSEADSAHFFIADNGKTNPRAEMLATLAAFFRADPHPLRKQPYACVFIARYHWLKQQLDFDPRRLSEPKCDAFKAWLNRVDPHSLTLVFPDAYLNNPSSMFGHTLLRIDQPEQNDKTRLSAFVINFSAQTTESNGLVFAVKGLTGGYPGVFSILPYYEKVKEYSDMESRDIWEYQLNFTREELLQLLRHAWELDEVVFEYYFFDENCSYHLLSLLEVGRPELSLTPKFRWWAIPTDTIRSVLAYPEILNQVTYRPSSQTKIQFQSRQLSEAGREAVVEIARSRVSDSELESALRPFSTVEQARILEAAYEYLQFVYYDDPAIERRAHTQRVLALLNRRSRLPAGEAFDPVPQPAFQPQQGHDTARVALGIGHEGQRDFAELKLRPAYHDVHDAEAGYLPGAQINFLDMTFRIDDERERIRLQQLTLVDVFSLTPRNEFFKPLSFRLQAEFNRLPYPGNEDEEHLYFSSLGAIGYAWEPVSNQRVGMLLEGTLLVHDALPADYGISAGPGIYWQWRASNRLKVWFGAKLMRFVPSPEQTLVDQTAVVNIKLSKNSALRLNWQRFGERHEPQNTTTLDFHYYF